MQKSWLSRLQMMTVWLLLSSLFGATSLASEGWRFAMGVGQSSDSHTAFRERENNEEETHELTVQSKFRYSEAKSLILEIINAPKYAWSLSAGVQIDLERKFNGGDVEVINKDKFQGTKQENFKLPANEDRLQIVNGYFNILFRHDFFYLPLGINYSYVKMIPGAASPQVVRQSKAWGGPQFGIGFFFGEHLNVEVLSRTVAYTIQEFEVPSAPDQDLTRLRSGLLQAKYIF